MSSVTHTITTASSEEGLHNRRGHSVSLKTAQCLPVVVNAEEHAKGGITDRNRWRLFICNTYLIPNKYSTAATATCERQTERAAALGAMIVKHEPDVVLLQEMWGAGYSALQKGLADGEKDAAKTVRESQKTDEGCELTPSQKRYTAPKDDWRQDTLRGEKDAYYKQRASRVCSNTTVTDPRTDSTYPAGHHRYEAVLGRTNQPPHYHIPRLMRSFFGIETIDVVCQYFSRRGGLMYAYNTATVSLGCTKGDGGGRYVPLLSQLRHDGFLTKGGVAKQSAPPLVRDRQLAVVGGFGTRDKLLTIAGASAQRLLGRLLPTYPQHHTFTTTHFKQHNKSVMVIKAVRKGDGGGGGAPATPLLLFNTHLDPCNLSSRHRIIERQLIELKAFIADVIEREYFATAIETTLEGGGIGDAPNRHYHAPFAAVVAGDFNIPTHNELYDRLFTIMGKGEMSVVLSSASSDPTSPPAEVVAEEHKAIGGDSFSVEGNQNVATTTTTAPTNATIDEEDLTAPKPSLRTCHPRARVVQSKIDWQELLPEASRGVHTYCCNNVTVQHPIDEGRLDHIFGIRSITLTTVARRTNTWGDGDEVSTNTTDGAEAEEDVLSPTTTRNTRTFTIHLAPVALSYERVLNNHAMGDALVSDHYPFVAEIVVGQKQV